jgi:hypothetical protein
LTTLFYLNSTDLMAVWRYVREDVNRKPGENRGNKRTITGAEKPY